MSHYSLLILLSTWSQSETIAASECFKYIWFSYHESWNRKDHGSEYWTGCNIKIRWGGGGGRAHKNPFPVIAYSVAYFRPHPSRLSRFFLLQFFPFLNLSLPHFFPTLKSRKRTTLFYGKFNPL